MEKAEGLRAVTSLREANPLAVFFKSRTGHPELDVQPRQHRNPPAPQTDISEVNPHLGQVN